MGLFSCADRREFYRKAAAYEQAAEHAGGVALADFAAELRAFADQRAPCGPGDCECMEAERPACASL